MNLNSRAHDERMINIHYYNNYKNYYYYYYQSPELRSCVKVEVAVLGSPSLTVLTVSVDVKQH